MFLSECLLLIEDMVSRSGKSLWSDSGERLKEAKPEPRGLTADGADNADEKRISFKDAASLAEVFQPREKEMF
jgi:hypothetical protein